MNTMNNGIYAKFTTSKGDILVQLEHEKTPGTVGNFVALANGNLENAVKPQGTPYYDGLKFHRVIPDFMIQGGCPQGTGTGNPGYKFDDEFHPDLKHDAPGKLAMANSGPATNGSQFYITHVPTPWLDGKHTVFGKVVKGQEIVDLIGAVETAAMDKPAEDIFITAVKIIRKGSDAKGFDAPAIFDEQTKVAIAKMKEAVAAKERELDEVSVGFEKTASGLRYLITQANESGQTVNAGDMIKVHYTGKLLDGKVFDSSTGKDPIQFNVGTGRVIPGWDEGLQLLKVGEKATLIIPSNLAYGERGGGPIPPNSTLKFDVELVEVVNK